MIESIFSEPFRKAGLRNDPALPPDLFASQGGLPKHVTSFSGVLNIMGRMYSQRFDEALKSGGTVDAMAMLRDPYLTALLRERMRPTAQRRWSIKCQEMDNPEKKQVCDMVGASIRKLKKFTMMKFALLKAIWFGRYGSMLQWAPRDVKGKSWKIPVSWTPINGDKIGFDWDMTPAIAVNPMLANAYQSHCVYTDTIPFLKLSPMQWRKQVIIHTHEVEDSDYSDITGAGAIAGTGVRGQIYWAWWLRDECLSWAMNFMQKVGTLGLTVIYYDQANDQAYADARQAAIDMSNKNVILIPRPMGDSKDVWGVEQFPTQSGGVDALMRIISEYFEKHIERLIIGQSLSGSDGGGGLGGAGVAMLHRDTKFQILSLDTANLDETLTADLVHQIIATNLPNEDPQDYWFESILPDPSQADALNAMTRIWEKVPIPVDEVYRVAGIRPPKDGEAVINPPPPPAPAGQPAAPNGAAPAPQGQPAPAVPPTTPQFGTQEAEIPEYEYEGFTTEIEPGFGEETFDWLDDLANPGPLLNQAFRGMK